MDGTNELGSALCEREYFAFEFHLFEHFFAGITEKYRPIFRLGNQQRSKTMRTLNDLVLGHNGKHLSTIFLAVLLLLATPAFSQEVTFSGGTSISGSVTTTSSPQVVTPQPPQPLSLGPFPLPSGQTGVAYGLNGQGVDIAASNGTGPYTCSAIAGLPTGISQSTNALTGNTNCHLGGTPTVAATSNFTISVTDSKGATGSLAASITITSTLAITQTTIPPMTIGNTYSPLIAFAATGGSGAGYSFALTAGTWPPGCTLTTPNLNCTPTQAGSFVETVTVTDSGANTASWQFTLTVNPQVVSAGADNRYAIGNDACTGITPDGPVTAVLTKCFYTPMSATPSPGTVRTTTAANFLATYNASACGDVIKVTGGTTVNGPITLTAKNCDNAHWITIEGSGVVSDVNFPTEGTRSSPCFSNVSSLPNRPAYPCGTPASDTAQFVATSSNSAIVLNGADHLRFIGIEFTRVTTAKALIYSIIDLTSTAAVQTNNIIFDRVWCHGVNADGTFPQNSSTDTSTTRCLYLGQSNHIALIDSYCSDFYDNGGTASNGNTDAQCIGGGAGSVANSGWGVYKFVNNHMEGASEGILLGGSGGPALTPAGCTSGPTGNCNPDVPTNVEGRRNYFFAPNSWNGNTTTINATGYPNRKNGWEMKTGANMLFEANVMENCWYSSQPACLVFDFAPKNQSDGHGHPTCPSCFVKNAVARYNYGYDYPGALFAVYSSMDIGCSTCFTFATNLSIHDNLVGDKLNRGSLTLTGFDGFEFLADAGPMTNISFFHNTVVNAYRSFLLMGSQTNSAGTSGFNNILLQNNIGTFNTASSGGPWLAGNGSTSGPCDLVTQTFQTYLNTCITTNTVNFNGVFNVPNINGWPSGNFFQTTTAGVQFVNYGTGDSSKTPGNYALQNTSPWHNAASDGSDLGANINQLNSELSGVAAY